MSTAEAAGQQDRPRLLNRQLSWLAFNRRVLALAEDASLPFADRMRFVSIWARNLDEYYQVRIASLKDDAALERPRSVDDGYSSTRQFSEIRFEVARQTRDARGIAAQLWSDVVAAGVVRVQWNDLDVDEQKRLHETFKHQVFPVLTPLAVDPRHPFPYISTLSLSLGLLIADPASGMQRFARVKIPADLIGRHIRVGDSQRFVAVEDLIRANLDSLFPGVDILEAVLFRVTRNADIAVTADLLDDFDDDLLSAVESELLQRRFGAVMRIEVEAGASMALRQVLLDELHVDAQDLYEIEGPLDLATWCDLDRIVKGREGFTLPKLSASVPGAFRESSDSNQLFARLRVEDVLVHHPYDSFDDTVVAFINAAADDAKVQAIKITLYRTSGDGSIVEALVRAAESGKQVVVVVELKARFDEEANISWARRLETAGVHVAYGFVALKVHTKVCLVVRREDDELVRYCHFGTGNYNALTADLYTDVGLFTAAPEFGADLSVLFNSLTGFHVPVDYEELVVAPASMRSRLRSLILNEAEYGDSGRIRAKMNSLVDSEMIEAFYQASSAGVQIELVVRGMCSLRAGVPGLSENITVRSILGRYLEHARLYWFAHGDDEGAQFLLGSADLMTRNLDRRVEALAPVHDLKCQQQFTTWFEANLADDRRAWKLASDGTWLPPDPAGKYEMHVELHRQRSEQ